MNNNVLGTLYVVAAPSGAGKTSLVNALVTSVTDMRLSVSHTTRSQRPGEKNSVHYWFVSETEFSQMVKNNLFLEHATVFGHHYGTSREWVEQQLRAGIDVVLEIDWQGARQVRAQFAKAITLFILPPSLDLLRQRLLARKQDDAQIIEQRLAAASAEVEHYAEFDYLIINDVFDHALSDLQVIVHSHRLLQAKQASKYTKLLANLLQKQ